MSAFDRMVPISRSVSGGESLHSLLTRDTTRCSTRELRRCMPTTDCNRPCAVGLPTWQVGLPAWQVGLPAWQVGLPALQVGLPAWQVDLRALHVDLPA